MFNIKNLFEGRIDVFKSKYSNKFNPEQLDKIVVEIPNKFLNWVGKNFEPTNFEQNLPILVQYLDKFDKISTNLPLTDINQYKSLNQLKSEIDKLSQKPRRQYQTVEGGNVVYDDGRFFVVNPQTHEASCYYGKGTKWCTASDSDFHFKNYNDDGKLFYILDTTKSSADPFYKIALLYKYIGDKIYFDAKDEKIKNLEGNEIIPSETFIKINQAIDEYINQEYADQIKIFSNILSQKKEQERIRRERIQRRLNSLREEAQERRSEYEWDLGPFCPEVGLKAHALLEWLVDNGDVEVKTPEDFVEINRLQVEIERLQTQYDESEDAELLGEISNLEDELDELENKIDVYNIVPVGDYYELTTFEVIDAGLEDRRYAVGTESETSDSCYTKVDELIDEIGYAGFNSSFVENYIDDDAVLEVAREVYEDDIHNNPESYFDDEERSLSEEQESEISQINFKIRKLQNSIEEIKSKIEYFEENWDDENDEEHYEKIEELEEFISIHEEEIEKLEEEIEEIKSSPEGDFPEDIIESKIEDYLSEVESDPKQFLDNFGFDVANYINRREFIEAVVDEDGYGHTLNHYDGNADEINVEGTYFWVMRID